MPTGEPAPETCPGCGAVLAPVAGAAQAHAGASPSCSRLFEVTLRGLREDGADPGVAATLRRADSAYALQHTTDDGRRPLAWRTTIADVAADLDVIDLAVLIAAWADAVDADLAGSIAGS
jgi:hypothetical protein